MTAAQNCVFRLFSGIVKLQMCCSHSKNRWQRLRLCVKITAYTEADWNMLVITKYMKSWDKRERVRFTLTGSLQTGFTYPGGIG